MSAARSIFSGKGTFFGMLRTNPEVVPVVSAAFMACCGATYCLVRSATRPDVVWSGRNDEPWNRVEQGKNFHFPAFSAGVPDVRMSGEDLRGKL
eukprot:m.57490 g.57490  ORF g.57490 m.57490 type:complete len:94 (+) comp7766_c0_seq1:1648-1929(+)